MLYICCFSYRGTFTFPAVTVCNHNILKRSKLNGTSFDTLIKADQMATKYLDENVFEIASSRRRRSTDRMRGGDDVIEIISKLKRLGLSERDVIKTLELLYRNEREPGGERNAKTHQRERDDTNNQREPYDEEHESPDENAHKEYTNRYNSSDDLESMNQSHEHHQIRKFSLHQLLKGSINQEHIIYKYSMECFCIGRGGGDNLSCFSCAYT